MTRDIVERAKELWSLLGARTSEEDPIELIHAAMFDLMTGDDRSHASTIPDIPEDDERGAEMHQLRVEHDRLWETSRAERQRADALEAALAAVNAFVDSTEEHPIVFGGDDQGDLWQAMGDALTELDGRPAHHLAAPASPATATKREHDGCPNDCDACDDNARGFVADASIAPAAPQIVDLGAALKRSIERTPKATAAEATGELSFSREEHDKFQDAIDKLPVELEDDDHLDTHKEKP